MYANNVFSKRRANGWAERRRRFDRFVEQARTKLRNPDKKQQDPSDLLKR